MNFRFCPRCGSPLATTTQDNQPVPTCQEASCGFIFWQNSKPCVVALLVDSNGQVLMTRRGIEPEFGKLDLPGGFLQLGELPEDGVVREVQEEIGVTVAVGAYAGAAIDRYPYQGLKEYILTLGFEVQVVSGTPAVADPHEITELVWVNPARVDHSELAFTGNAWYLNRLAQQQQNTISQDE